MQVKRRYKTYSIIRKAPNLGAFLGEQLLFLTSNDKGRALLAFGLKNSFKATEQGGLATIQEACATNDWLFGYLSYELKNEIELLHSKNVDNLNFPLVHLWQAQVVFEIEKEKLHAYYLDYSEAELDALVDRLFVHEEEFVSRQEAVVLVPRIDEAAYLAKLQAIQKAIQAGELYETNFCQEFFAEETTIKQPWQVFQQINTRSEAPFAAYMQDGEFVALSASPEEFISKKGNTLQSTPIKGTSRRGATIAEDEFRKFTLATSEKEQAENVMIVDLVRNDFAKIAQKGTVKVASLFEVQSFKTVHQLCSRIQCELKAGTRFSDIIQATFPMGSMTGAPKISAMKIAEELESTKRGLYSGAIGFIEPNSDFQFSVVIRTVLYNRLTNYISLMVGGAITAKSIPTEEYKECLLKAEAIIQALKA